MIVESLFFIFLFLFYKHIFCNYVFSTSFVLDVVSGCTWSAWSEWSECTKSCGGGNIKRIREKLPCLGPCDGMGDKEDIVNCVN